MPLYVIDKEAILAFRRNHRAGVQKSRRTKRQKRLAAPRRSRRTDEIDRNWLNAVDRDFDKGDAGQS